MSESDFEDDYEYGGFEVDLYEAPPLGDSNSYRLQNAPGENQRRHIVQEGKKDLTFHGDLFAVVHGTLTPDGDEATLIVMEFTFSGSEAYKRRFRKVDIMLKFGNGLGEEKVGGRDDPEVRAIAPEGEFELAQESTEEVSTVLTAGVSAPIAQGIVELSAGIERGKTTVRTTRAKVFGAKRIEDRRYGKQNAALWILTEDKIGQTGVPSTLRAAVLVVPQTEDGFRVFVDVDLTADLLFATEVKTRRMLGRSKVDPVYFSYERENFGPELPGVDPDNLSKCKLSDLSFFKTSTIV